MDANKIIQEYLIKFEEMPPMDAVISYEDDLYLNLMQEALKTGNPITPEMLENAIGNEPYDYVNEEGEDKMEEQKIRTMLKRYGAVDEEIENFMQDLANFKEEAQEDEDEEEFSPYSSDVTARLRETEEGKKILMNAPKMEREAFIKAVKDYLAK